MNCDTTEFNNGDTGSLCLDLSTNSFFLAMPLIALGTYPANMLAVTVRPMQRGAQGERVCLLTAPMITTVVRNTVIATSASVALPRSLVLG